MAEQQYEYHVEPTFLSPTGLPNDRYKLHDLLKDRAEDGWVYEDAVVVDSSSLLFFFRRPVESSSKGSSANSSFVHPSGRAI